MSIRDALMFRELVERVGALQDEIGTLKMRLSSLQGQINSQRALIGRLHPRPPPDAPANSRGDSDAARQ
jgi:hypothetical protein